MFETRTGTVPVTKEMVKAACRKVKANHGTAAVDKESPEQDYHPIYYFKALQTPCPCNIGKWWFHSLFLQH